MGPTYEIIHFLTKTLLVILLEKRGVGYTYNSVLGHYNDKLAKGISPTVLADWLTPWHEKEMMVGRKQDHTSIHFS